MCLGNVMAELDIVPHMYLFYSFTPWETVEHKDVQLPYMKKICSPPINVTIRYVASGQYSRKLAGDFQA